LTGARIPPKYSQKYFTSAFFQCQSETVSWPKIK
jgi:hypothetical protein